MADQAIIDLKERIAHRAAVVGQLESVSAAKLDLGSAHYVVQLRLGMDEMNEVLVIQRHAGS